MSLTDKLSILGGADPDTLKQVPSARSQFVQMSLVLISTAGLAGVSMWFALTDGVRIGTGPAIVVALVWALVILNIDRFLTSNMRSTVSWQKSLAMAVPRICMAALIGLVVSTPLVLRVFESDIEAAMERYSAETSAANATRIKDSSEQKEVTRLENAVLALKNAKAGAAPVPSTPAVQQAQGRVKDLTASVATQRPLAAEAQKLYICERYGAGRAQLKDPSRCSPQPGTNGPYQQIKAEAEQQAKLLQTLESQLETAQRDLNSTIEAARRAQAGARQEAGRRAAADLPAAEAQLAAAQKRLETLKAGLGDSNEDDRGILAQLRGLSILGEQNSSMKTAHYAIGGIFFMIELLPVLVKLLLNWNSPSLYDRIRESTEDSALDEAKSRRAELRRSLAEDSKKRQDVADDMRVREKALGIRANKYVAERMEVILDKALDEWDNEVRQAMATTPQSATQSPAGAQRNGARWKSWRKNSTTAASAGGTPRSPSTVPGAIQTTFNLPDGGKL